MPLLQSADGDVGGRGIPVGKGHCGKGNFLHFSINIQIRNLDPVSDIQLMMPPERDECGHALYPILENPAKDYTDDTNRGCNFHIVSDVKYQHESDHPDSERNQFRNLAPGYPVLLS
jgi:hypothetical protein